MHHSNRRRVLSTQPVCCSLAAIQKTLAGDRFDHRRSGALTALASSHPLVAEPVWGLGGFAVGAGVLSPSGFATVPVTIPNLPWLEHHVLMLQAVSGSQLPVHASPPIGGVIH